MWFRIGTSARPCEHGTAAAVPQNVGNFLMSWGTISFSSVIHAVSYSDRHAVNVVVWCNVGMLVELLFVYVQLISKLRFCKVWHSAFWCMGTICVEELFVSSWQHRVYSLLCCQSFSTKGCEVTYCVPIHVERRTTSQKTVFSVFVLVRSLNHMQFHIWLSLFASQH